MQALKQGIYNFLRKKQFGNSLINVFFHFRYKDSASYWEKRYGANRNSGSGSYGALATYKADIINRFIAENKIENVIEFGCGDGNQLKQFVLPFYTGLDVSATIIERNTELFKNDTTKKFYTIDHWQQHQSEISAYDLALSLDVVYHLVEQEVYEKYIYSLFAASERFVIIYAWDTEQQQVFHIKHRNFTTWVQAKLPGWKLVNKIENTALPESCDFFIYQKLAAAN